MLGKESLGYSFDADQSASHQNKFRSARRIGNRCQHDCEAKTARSWMCNEVDEEKGMNVFHEFWQLHTWSEKKIFAKSFIEKKQQLRRRNTEDGSRKEKGFDYFLPSASGTKVKVCKQIFLNTLVIGGKQLRGWLSQPNDHHDYSIAPRNTTNLRSPKITNGREFILKLPRVPSHYCRSSTSKKHVDAAYTVNLSLIFTTFTPSSVQRTTTVQFLGSVSPVFSKI